MEKMVYMKELKDKEKTDEIKEKERVLKTVRSDPELSYYEEIIRKDERKQLEQKEQEYNNEIKQLNWEGKMKISTIVRMTTENNQLKKDIERLNKLLKSKKIKSKPKIQSDKLEW